MPPHPAIRAALDLYHLPAGIRLARRKPLPDGLVALLQIVSGDRGVAAEAASQTNRSIAEIDSAATFYVEQILFAPDADSYRVLGAHPTDLQSDIRRNMALLSRWLHPDVRTSVDRVHFVERLTEAWNDVKTPERRAALDQRLAEASLQSLRRRRSSRSKNNSNLPKTPKASPAGSRVYPRHHAEGFFRRIVRKVFRWRLT